MPMCDARPARRGLRTPPDPLSLFQLECEISGLGPIVYRCHGHRQGGKCLASHAAAVYTPRDAANDCAVAPVESGSGNLGADQRIPCRKQRSDNLGGGGIELVLGLVFKTRVGLNKVPGGFDSHPPPPYCD
jgi:hypothetical protein